MSGSIAAVLAASELPNQSENEVTLLRLSPDKRRYRQSEFDFSDYATNRELA